MRLRSYSTKKLVFCFSCVGTSYHHAGAWRPCRLVRQGQKAKQKSGIEQEATEVTEKRPNSGFAFPLLPLLPPVKNVCCLF